MEMSTIEKVRVRVFCEDAMPMSFVMFVVLLFTAWHCYRLAFLHPDVSIYPMVIFSTKPWVEFYRASKKHTLDEHVHRFVFRCPELYGVSDPIRELYKVGAAANDPYLERVKALGKEKDLYVTTRDYKPHYPNLGVDAMKG
jgi:hypothetical protein